ncbi:DUF6220 domain-containing protein [Sinomonas sp. ASV322]|uniref:DUF6220 domain-containing protein n=1 Tax=Sinomonas sp. ASV322 TaxID=3041920 RepID=UPI0027DCFFA0|nr:DUF6220 domain-containing protein [Sinomonas sp. ASV322]MDQ4503187.1 DUF6220 domain-containing protein [Sinomonas sp. ASV322]
MRKLFLGVSALLFLDTLLQLYFAGFGVFGEHVVGGDESFTPHSINGQFVLRGLALLAILFAALAKAGRSTIWLTVGIFLMTYVQLIVFILGGILSGGSREHPNLPGAWMVSVHAVTGLLIIFMTYWLFRRARRLVRTGSARRAGKRQSVSTSA